MRLYIATLLLLLGSNAHAWGDKGHEVVVLIAWHYLSPATRNDLETLLQRDRSGLSATDVVSEANWADAYRDFDRDTTQIRYEQTRRWHYINLKLKHPDIASACFHSPPLKPTQRASDGSAKACVVDKIEQFAAELRTTKTAPEERLIALQFLIHLVGDLHQPLHAIDNDDSGGNDVRISAKGFKQDSLHGYWDNAVVKQLGRKPETIARHLISQIEVAEIERWRRGTPHDWALETFELARDITYKKLPPASHDGVHILDDDYKESAKTAAAQQLMRAGVRLAQLLESSTPPQ